MDFGGNGNTLRFTVANLVIPSIAAVTTTEVQVALNGVKTGDIGIAIPIDAKFTNGLGINPVRASADNVGQIPFVNGSAAAIDAADTFDFVVVMFRQTGAIAGAV